MHRLDPVFPHQSRVKNDAQAPTQLKKAPRDMERDIALRCPARRRTDRFHCDKQTWHKHNSHVQHHRQLWLWLFQTILPTGASGSVHTPLFISPLLWWRRTLEMFKLFLNNFRHQTFFAFTTTWPQTAASYIILNLLETKFGFFWSFIYSGVK